MSSPATSAAVHSSISALLKWKEEKSSTQKPQLLPEDEFIYLILTLKKIPAKPRTNAFKIPLPHPLHSSSDICLIVDDRPKSKPDAASVKQLIKAHNLPIAKLIKLSKLKTNYKPFEAKRKLCDSYDLFLVDKRVVHFLPKLIGKSFFKKKKIPIPVDMVKNWTGKVEKAVTSGLLYFRTGTCCVMKVGKVGMERAQIEENVREGVRGVVECVPSKWGGVRSLHVKFADSVALPLYQALPDLKLKIEGVRKEVEESESEGESLKGDGLVSDRKSLGRKKDKGRIHEVRYMDVGLTEEELGSQDSDGDEKIEEVASDSEAQEVLGKKEDAEDELKSIEKVKKSKGVKRQALASAVGGEPSKKGKKVQKLAGKGEEVVAVESNDNVSGDATVKKTKKGEGVKGQVGLPADCVEPSKKGRKVQKLQGDKESVVKKGNKRSEPVVKATKEKRSKKKA